MVIRILFYLLLFLPVTNWAQDVKVTAEVEESGIIVNQPMRGTITITHSKNDQVDQKSFRLEDQPLQVELAKSVQLSPNSDLMLTIYSFTLPGKPGGLYVLKEITVNVGGKSYQSIPSTFEVRKVKKSSPKVSKGVKAPKGVSVLRLEAEADGELPMYPGQRIRLVYRYFYNVNFDLTREELPLLNPKGFEKIGGKEVSEYEMGNLSVLEISQIVEAVKPGEFSIGPSVIEGYPYITGVFGRKEYGKNKLQSEVPAVKIQVKAFPKQGKPTSFNGAVGNYTDFQVSLLPRPNIVVGDKLTLIFEISGKGQLETLPLPPLAGQPGILGFFRMSDLPAVGEIHQNKKRFVVELRPLNPSIKEIPGFTFAFFNPKDESYHHLKSDPIPLTVEPVRQDQQQIAPQGSTEEKVDWDTQTLPIAVEGNYPLTTSDLKPLRFGTWWVLLLIPFGIGILFLQWQMRDYLEKRKEKIKTKKASQLFEEAWVHKDHPPVFFRGINQAFLTRLYERGEIKDKDLSPEQLSDDGFPGEVRELLTSIDKLRFAGEETVIEEQLLNEMRDLYERMESE